MPEPSPSPPPSPTSPPAMTPEQVRRVLTELADWIELDPTHRLNASGRDWLMRSGPALRYALARLEALDAVAGALGTLAAAARHAQSSSPDWQHLSGGDFVHLVVTVNQACAVLAADALLNQRGG